jgi:ATP/maltotriose-dependent transcriptional regulator MalT
MKKNKLLQPARIFSNPVQKVLISWLLNKNLVFFSGRETACKLVLLSSFCSSCRRFHFFSLLLVFMTLTACHFEKNEKENTRFGYEKEAFFPNTASSDSILLLVDKYEKEAAMNDSLLAEMHYQAGMQFYQRGEYSLSKELFQEAEMEYQKSGFEKKAIQMLSNRAVLDEIQGNYALAVKKYIQALSYYQSMGDSISISKVYSNLGVLYEELELADKALLYHRKAIKIRKSINDKTGIANTYNNIGVLFEELTPDEDSALYYYRKAYTYFQQDSSMRVKSAIVLSNMGKIYIDQQHFDQAKQALNKAVQLLLPVGESKHIAHVYRNLGELFFAQKNYHKAKQYYQKSYEIYNNLGERKNLLEVLELLSTLTFYNGDYIHAAKYMNRYNGLKDSLINEKNNELIAEMESKYQLHEKNKTITILKLENQANRRRIRFQYFVIFSILIIVLLIVWLFYIYSHRNKLLQTQMRLELHNYLLKIGECEEKIKDTRQTTQEQFKKQFEKYELTEREVEVLQLISKGYKNTEIAEHLFVSLNTVKTHIKNIYVKLDVKNRVEALQKVSLK